MKGYGEIFETKTGHRLTVWGGCGSRVENFDVEGGYMFTLKQAEAWFNKNGFDDWEVEDKTYTT